MALVREENPDDHAAIRKVNQLAFQGDVEARLVDDLRSNGAVIASLVAVEGGNIVGHILFSDLLIETEASCPSCRLAGTDGRRPGISAPGHRFSVGAAWTRGMPGAW